MKGSNLTTVLCSVFLTALFCLSALSVLQAPTPAGKGLLGVRGVSGEQEKPLNVLVNGTGDNAGDRFGWNVSSAGDINDDGFDDLIVGAPYYNDGVDADVGAVYIFFGKADWTGGNISAAWADVKIIGPDANDHFGWSVACAGDINWDGIDDVIIGSPDEEWGGGTNNRGRAYIFYGYSTFGTISTMYFSNANETLSGTANDQRFGFSVAGVGDVNDDGYDDIAIGAPGGAYTRIHFGYDSVTRYYITADPSNPLWDDTLSTKNDVDFNSLNHTGNVFAPGGNPCNLVVGGNDGWDWSYSWNIGHTDWWAPAYQNSSHFYGPKNETGEGYPLANTSHIQVQSGPSNKGGDGMVFTGQDRQDYCAWGCQIPITTGIWNNLTGKSVYIAFDWEAFDTGQALYDAGIITAKEGTNHYCLVRSQFFRSGTNPANAFLGTDLDGWGMNEVFQVTNTASSNNNNWGWNNATLTNPRMGHFSQDVTATITGANDYYFTFGVNFIPFVFGGGTATCTANQGIGAYLDNVTMYAINQRHADITITGANQFGWDVAGAGDVDNDGLDDLIISNPQMGVAGAKGEVYVFCGYPSIASTTHDNANATLSGQTIGSLFGYSIDAAGNVNNDNYDDILVGAPKENKAYIFYGKAQPAKTITYIDRLWDDNPTTPAVVDFDTEANNTNADLNTFGIYTPSSASDDGWDWAQNIYGAGATPGTFVTFWSPNEASGGPDTLTAVPGGTGVGMEIYGFSNAYDVESGAWGCQFNITPTDYSSITSGSHLFLRFNYSITDHSAGGTEEPWHIKARVGNSNGSMWYVGKNLDGGTISYGGSTWNDPTPEIRWFSEHPGGLGGAPNFGTFAETGAADLTANITGSGTYYLDFGCKYMTGGSGTGNDEGIEAIFTDVVLMLQPVWTLSPNVILNGSVNESFGHSVAGKLNSNGDAYSDVIIGNPWANNSVGPKAGASYLFYGGASLPAKIDAQNADYINYASNYTEQFGFSVANIGNFCGSGFSNPGIGAPFFSNATMANKGKAYVLGTPPFPVVNVVYPNGGETVSGTITINATAWDPNADLNLVSGVKFAIRSNGMGSSWNLIGTDNAGTANMFDVTFDTTTVPDGQYWVKANVTDLASHFKEDWSDNYFTIDNPWAPWVQITSPNVTQYLNGTVSINAHAEDIDGPLNYTKGVEFYYSLDNGTADQWHFIGADNVTASGNNFVYSLWNISAMPDGVCYLMANVSDTEGLFGVGYGSFNIENPKMAPVVTILNPWNLTVELTGNVKINATAIDVNNDINATGVTFYYANASGIWVKIGSDATPAVGIYEVTWNSIGMTDGMYSFMAEATDLTNKTGSDTVGEFMIHNNLNNPPIVNVLYPNNNEVFSQSGSITIRAMVMDLENNVNAEGARFYYSEDGASWVYIGNDATGVGNIYEIAWDTNVMPDGFYIIKVNATDITGFTGEDTTNTTFLIHNKMDNAPRLNVIYPNGGEVVSGTINVTCWAFDFENNINTVGIIFYYSDDVGATWNVVGSVNTPVNNVYTIAWDTTKVNDGNKYLINASATDITSRLGFDLSNSTFSVKNNQFSAPEIDLLAPAADATVSGLVDVTAWAFDLDGDISSEGVVFSYLPFGETNWTEIGSDATPDVNNTYSVVWDTNTTATPNGDYLVRAEVEDDTALSAISTITAVIHISNAGNVEPVVQHPPAITILAPAANAVLKSTITISASATDLDGDLKWVEFYYQSYGSTRAPGPRMLLANKTVTSATIYNQTWDTNTSATPNGAYTIIVIGKDAMGNTVEKTVTVSVNNPSIPIQPDDDDDDTSIFAGLWWLWVLLALLLLIIIIVIIIIVMRRKKEVEVRIGPFMHEDKPLDGRVTIVVEDKEYSGGTDKDGIAHIAKVPEGEMGKDAMVKPEFDENHDAFNITLEKDIVLEVPKAWAKKVEKKDDKKPMTAAMPPKAETVKDEKPQIGTTPAEAKGLPGETGGTKALPPAKGAEKEGEDKDNTPDDASDIDDADLPEDEKDPDLEEANKMDAKSSKPEELDEDDIDIDEDMDVNDVDIKDDKE